MIGLERRAYDLPEFGLLQWSLYLASKTKSQKGRVLLGGDRGPFRCPAFCQASLVTFRVSGDWRGFSAGGFQPVCSP